MSYYIGHFPSGYGGNTLKKQNLLEFSAKSPFITAPYNFENHNDLNHIEVSYRCTVTADGEL